MNNKTLIPIYIISMLFVVGMFILSSNKTSETNNEISENGETSDYTQVESPEFGIAFSFRSQGPNGYTIIAPSENELDKNQVFLRTLMLSKDYEEFKESSVAREGPTAITIETYRNPTSRLVQEWVENNSQSNYSLIVGSTSAISYKENEYITYMWDGLYRADTYVTEKNGYIYVFTVTYTDSNSSMRDDLKEIITSVTFNEPAILAQTAHNMIRVSNPKPNAVIKSPLTISGEARGNWFFEASFPIALTDWDGRIIAQHYIMTADEWMTEDFVTFSGEISFEKPYRQGSPDFMRRGTLILQKDNPSGLPEFDDAIELPIIFD